MDKEKDRQIGWTEKKEGRMKKKRRKERKRRKGRGEGERKEKREEGKREGEEGERKKKGEEKPPPFFFVGRRRGCPASVKSNFVFGFNPGGLPPPRHGPEL
ncbi:hypothetical protein [Escherichia coli]|uniref:hypothetical protein n=1 Tax=Escherichia coli TaxID=562 RepID=UPI0015941CC7|nr:hypothetical protein [Escherichia coli]NUM20116.1 hypothetical protein [Escherichia coli]